MKKPDLPKGWHHHTRETGLLEAICPCGVGHPLPEAFQPVSKRGPVWSIHGCCGCCLLLEKVTKGTSSNENGDGKICR